MRTRKNGRTRGGNGYAISRDLTPRLVSVAKLTSLGQATRKHSAVQVRKLAASINRFGFVLPIVIDAEGRVVAGWAMLLAARQLDLIEVPAVRIADLPEAELRALRLALNRLSEDAAWDRAALTLELRDIVALAPQIELAATGFEIAEIELALGTGAADIQDEPSAVNAEDGSAPIDVAPVSRPGDLWLVGRHRVLCADPRLGESYARVLAGAKADMMVTKPPIDGDDGVDDAATTEGTALLKICLAHAASASSAGAPHLISLNWTRMREVLAAGAETYGALADLLIKALGSVETEGLQQLDQLIFLYVVGNIARSTKRVAFRSRRPRPTAGHPHARMALAAGTPGFEVSAVTAVTATAISTYSKVDAVILDPFGQAGATLIAAEHTGRRARVIERDPMWVDRMIARWQRVTGEMAVNEQAGTPFAHTGDSATRPSQAPTD